MIRPPKSNSLWLPNLWLPEAKYMSPGYPCCCEKNCGPCNSPETDITVDIGTGGWWTDGSCNYCDQPSGEYALTWFPEGGQDCNWLYYEDDVCSYSGGTGDFQILASVLGTTSYTWDVQIWIQDRQAPSTGRAIVAYRMGPTTNSDCWSEVDGDGKLTLTKFSESHELGVCSGTATPATIKIWQP